MIHLISQCAIAVVPESLAAVQAVLAKLDPAAGSVAIAAKGVISAKSAKSAKDAKGEVLRPPPRYADPLDRPVIPPIPRPPPVSPLVP